ncbi:MAG TPA: hypothetical protein PKA53_08280, partial [Sphingobacterium sp.]|nr:hypothetical protein [Sphingobacterium sp.]
MRRPTLQSHNASNPSLDLYATRILNQMRTNGDIFVDPMPPLADLDSVLVEFRHAVADAAHRDQRAILLRGQKRKELLRIIRLLSFYVAQIADGDENIILLSGFEPSRIPSSSGATPKPK